MTNILLSIIIALLFARIVLQVRQGKRVVEKGYAAPSEVHKVVVDGNSIEDLRDKLCDKWWYCDYELESILEDRGIFYAFLQSKKIKTYYEE